MGFNHAWFVILQKAFHQQQASSNEIMNPSNFDLFAYLVACLNPVNSPAIWSIHLYERKPVFNLYLLQCLGRTDFYGDLTKNSQEIILDILAKPRRSWVPKKASRRF